MHTTVAQMEVYTSLSLGVSMTDTSVAWIWWDTWYEKRKVHGELLNKRQPNLQSDLFFFSSKEGICTCLYNWARGNKVLPFTHRKRLCFTSSNIMQESPFTFTCCASFLIIKCYMKCDWTFLGFTCFYSSAPIDGNEIILTKVSVELCSLPDLRPVRKTLEYIPRMINVNSACITSFSSLLQQLLVFIFTNDQLNGKTMSSPFLHFIIFSWKKSL